MQATRNKNKPYYFDEASLSSYSKVNYPDIPIPSRYDGWIIYGSSKCKFCISAQTILSNYNYDFKYYDIDEYGGAQHVKEILHQRAKLPKKIKNVPIIYMRDHFIGGYSDLIDYLR